MGIFGVLLGGGGRQKPIKTVNALKLWLLLRNMDTAIMLNFTRDCQIPDRYVAYMSIWYKVHYFQ